MLFNGLHDVFAGWNVISMIEISARVLFVASAGVQPSQLSAVSFWLGGAFGRGVDVATGSSGQVQIIYAR